MYNTAAFKSTLQNVIKVYSEDKFPIICNHIPRSHQPVLLRDSAFHMQMPIPETEIILSMGGNVIKAHLTENKNPLQAADGPNLGEETIPLLLHIHRCLQVPSKDGLDCFY